MAFVETLVPFFADFGEEATLAGLPVRVIFDGPGGNTLGLSTESPVVQIASASVPAAYQGAQLVLARGTFRVREHQPDGTGLSLLLLTKV